MDPVEDVDNADFLDCMRFREMATSKHTRNLSTQSTNGFVATTSLVSLTELGDKPCAETTSTRHAEPNAILEMIRNDFGSSSESDANNDCGHYVRNVYKLRFKRKNLKTYGKERTQPAGPAINSHDTPDRPLSSSSGLSVEGAEIDGGPTIVTMLGHLDASNSQSLCENLKNLGEYFSTSNNITSTSLNSNKTIECVDDDKYSAEIPTHNDKTVATESHIWEDWSDNDSILADYTTEPSDDICEEKEKKKNTVKSRSSCKIDMTTDIPLSAEQKPNKPPALQMNEQFEMASSSTETVGFRTASKKLITLSEATKNRGSLLLNEITTAPLNTEDIQNNANQPTRPQKGLSRIVGTRAKSKNISLVSKTREPHHKILNSYDPPKSQALNIQKEVSKAIESSSCQKDYLNLKKVDNKLADLTTSAIEIKIPSKESKPFKTELEAEAFNTINLKVVKEVQSIQISQSGSPKGDKQPTSNGINLLDIQRVLLTCQEIIRVSQETVDKAIKVRDELQTMCLENQEFNDPPPVPSMLAKDESAAFHTACKQLLGVSDEAKNKVNKILADFEESTLQNVLTHKPGLIEFHTVCKKMINMLQESKNIVFKVLYNVDESEESKFPHGNSDNSMRHESRKSEKDPENSSAKSESDEQLNNTLKTKSASFEEDFKGFRKETSKQRNQENGDDVCRREPRFKEGRLGHSLKLQPEAGFGRTPSTRDIHPSLSQLAKRSPIDKCTKSAIIGRRNLLTLNRRKLEKRMNPEVNIHLKKDVQNGFAQMSPVTSTPLIDRNPNVIHNSLVLDLRNNGVHGDLSPIYTPAKKKRRGSNNL